MFHHLSIVLNRNAKASYGLRRKTRHLRLETFSTQSFHFLPFTNRSNATRRVLPPKVVTSTSSCSSSLINHFRNISLPCSSYNRYFSDTDLFVGNNPYGSPDNLKYSVPRRLKQKIVTANDAVELVRSGDTVAVSGFVTQGSPEAILQALGKRFESDGSPRDLTLLFGGGPGDYGERGLSHLAKVKTMPDGTEICMLKRTIGGETAF